MYAVKIIILQLIHNHVLEEAYFYKSFNTSGASL